MHNIPPMKILVAEDERTTALHICKQLEKNGHTPHHAPNGDEAIKALSNNYYDMIFMDIQMPKINGLEATHKIRSADEAYATIPIIGLSSEESPPADKHCLNAGMNDFMPKPFSMQRFEQTFWHLRNRKIFKETT